MNICFSPVRAITCLQLQENNNNFDCKLKNGKICQFMDIELIIIYKYIGNDDIVTDENNSH